MGTPAAMIALPIFDILTMALLLNVHIKEVPHRKRMTTLLFLAAMVVLNVWVAQAFGMTIYRASYLFLVQLLSFILFRILTTYRSIKLLFVTLTTITMAAIPMNINLTVSTLFIKFRPVTGIVLVLSCILVLALSCFFMKPDFNYILQYGDSKEFWEFCIIPVVYYVYYFDNTGYNFSKELAAAGLFLQQLPDVIVFIFYMLAINIFRNTREKQLLKSEQDMLFVRLSASEQKLSELHTTTMQAAAYRHDLRHHLSLLRSFAEGGDMEKNQEISCGGTGGNRCHYPLGLLWK